MTHITTFSGMHFDLAEPTPEMVTIVDIAHHLSQVCRWAGATKKFYSVAQHSVFLSYIVPDHLQRWALVHDAAEAYIGDVTRPLKNMIPEIRAIEFRIMRAICTHFHLSFPEPHDLLLYDDQCIRYEAETFLQKHDGNLTSRIYHRSDFKELTEHQRQQLPDSILRPMNPDAAELVFALRFHEIFHI
jgi:uncharacterized protein